MNRKMKTKLNKDSISATAGIWGDIGKTGAEYQRRIREGWSKRLKKLNWQFLN